MMRLPSFAVLAAALALVLAAPPAARSLEMQETETLGRTHDVAALPPVAERVPREPLVVRFEHGGSAGRHGGDLDTLIGRAKDARLINVWGYARLVGYDQDLELVPDILREVEVEDGRIFTLHLREGHKWSDGWPFTAEDIRYWWQDIVHEPKLTPSGADPFMMVDDEEPEFEVVDRTTVRFAWKKPNPLFLPALAAARPPFIYRPAHYLKRYHEKYGDPREIAREVDRLRVSSWAALHNQMDDMYGATNPDLPTLQPWQFQTDSGGQRFVMIRNPFYHRVDENGLQLPYVDRVIMSLADGRLINAKAHAGETDLQARGLAFSDMAVLKRGEAMHGYKTLMWPMANSSHLALYPNLTTTDETWRALMHDPRFRHALSLGIDREMINRVLFLGLARAAQNTVLPQSPLYEESYAAAFAAYDPEAADQLLDDIGLTERRSDGIRLLPDGRPLEIIVETAGESAEQLDVLALVGETWREIGVGLYAKPSQREVLRNRGLSGGLLMSVWSGWDNGVPTPAMSPEELAPVRGDALNWPLWGDHWESRGTTGEPVDYEPAARLLDLYRQWLSSGDEAERTTAWREMLRIHAEETFIIGLVTEVLQPVAVSDKLHNVPEDAFYGWDPGAQFGIWRMDQFWLEP